MTVTSRPAPTSRSAADNPARPAPTTTTWSVGPGTVRRRGTAIGEPGSEPTGGGRHAELAEHDASLVGALRDHAFDVCEGAGPGDDLAQCRHAGGVQAGVAQVPAQHRGLPRVRALPGGGHQRRPLALAEVVTRGFAGLGRVAEDTEYVVAQLESLAQRHAVRGETGQHVRTGAGQHGAGPD